MVTLTLATINAANPDPATFLANTDVDGKIKVTPSTDITDIAGIAYAGDEITELNASHFLEDDPVVERVWSSNADDTYNKPDVINIIITFDENVYVGGVSLPQLTLETGAGGANYPADAVVDYSIGSSTDDLTFPYTVATGHYSADLEYESTFALDLINDATIKDLYGNDAILTLPALGTTNSLAGTGVSTGDGSDLVINTITISTEFLNECDEDIDGHTTQIECDLGAADHVDQQDGHFLGGNIKDQYFNSGNQLEITMNLYVYYVN